MATSLELAIIAIRLGRREEGRQLLNLLIQQNPNNEMAWLWMSSVVHSDEQRARCLYHVLAINPDNVLARRGLKVLGIVVSDSRPVKVPRDSQPIKIPKPLSPPQAGPLKALPEPQSTAARRPFRIDAQAIVEELPFTPIKPPFSKPVQVVTAGNPRPMRPLQPQTEPGPTPAGPVLVLPPSSGPTAASPYRPAQSGPLPYPAEPAPGDPMPAQTPASVQPQTQTGSQHQAQPSPPTAPARPPFESPSQLETQPLQSPSEPMPAVAGGTEIPTATQTQTQTGSAQHPSEPVPTVASNSATAGQPLPQTPPQLETQRLQHPSEPVPVGPPQYVQLNQMGMPVADQQTKPDTGPMESPAGHQSPLPGGAPVQPGVTYPPPSNTGPIGGAGPYPAVGPMSTTDTRPTQPVPEPHSNPTTGMPFPAQNTMGHPSPSTAPLHSNVTMGMPSPSYPQPPYSHSVAAIHSQATAGMPVPAYGPPSGQGNGYSPHPSEPVPVVYASTAMGMPHPAYMQAQQQMPGPAYHSNFTMPMPTSQPSPVDYRALNTAQFLSSQKSGMLAQEDEEEEGLNILAVIIFGSLSVTALGGLGMLILLMFTGN